jgi:hypothetical protein
MKRYYIVASVFFYGIVTQTEAGVITTQSAQAGLGMAVPNVPGAMQGAAQSFANIQMAGIPAPMAGAIQPTVNAAPQDILPSPIMKGVIAQASLEAAQKALDDSSAFVLNDGQRVACFGEVNGTPRAGLVKPAENGQPAQCYTLDPNTAKMTPVDKFTIPVSTVPFQWRAGSSINPDEWVTGTNGLPTADYTNPVTGVCAQKDQQTNKPILIGAAVRRQGTQHVCVLPNGLYPLNHPQILVLAK